MPQITRDKLRQRFLDTRGHWVPEGPKGKMPGGDLPRRPYVRSDERAIGYVPYQKGELPDPLPATLVAFYLPQFHTIPENDEWWGKGFTEWRNVTRALPQFEGHYQPKLPGDLGFYDLRNVEVMHEQARLAREYGISAFCFYFYWFGGKTLLETPLRNWLNDKTIDLKFCLCWANEKWTRTWDGRGDEILIDQKHSPEDDIAFIEHVAEYMRDPRYLRVDGKPLLIVYRPGQLPEADATAARWRTWCAEAGIGPIELAYVQSFDSVSPRSIGFDAAIEFPPNASGVSEVASKQTLINPAFSGKVRDWNEMARYFESREAPQYVCYPAVNPSWDNQSRRPGSGLAYVQSSPDGYRRWLNHAITRAGVGRQTQLPVFINAWNEWSESATLEPDTRHGYAWLHATRESLRRHTVVSTPTRRPCVIVHAWYPDILQDLLDKLQSVCPDCRLIITTSPERENEIKQVMSNCRFDNAEVCIFENRGRDILPFLSAASRLRLEGEDIVLKLHTKRSPHLLDGDAWREQLVRDLIGGDQYTETLSMLHGNPDIGVVAPQRSLVPLSQNIGANSSAIRRLAGRAGIERSLEDVRFIAGSMFWIRLSALAPLLNSNLEISDFENESGQIDGTNAHAVERLIVASAELAGFQVLGQSAPHTAT
jgi:lipopolysaccharide biosynthesis protein